MRGGFALRREIGRQNHFAHWAFRHPCQQLVDANVFGAYALQRVDPPHQHKVQALVGAGALERRLVGRGFYYAQLGGVATLIAAGAANAQVSQGVATLAMLNVLNGMV